MWEIRSWRTRLLWAMGTAAAAVGGVALAATPVARPPADQAVLVDGTLTYVWHGDPARGCAAEGLCGARGSVTVSFDGYGTLVLFGRSGSAQLESASATARVRRVDPGMTPGECVDAISLLGFGIQLDRGPGGRYLARLDSTPASSGRCAGPLARELSGLRLPASRLPARALGFDLRGRVAFAAGPFSGELISGLVLAPDTVDQIQVSTSETTSSSSGPPAPAPHRRLVEYASVRYRTTGAFGALTTTFAGDPPPYCSPLDDCRVTGALSLGIRAYRDVLQVSATRIVRHRIARRRALADLRSGRLNFDLGGFYQSVLPGRLSESMSRAGGLSCRDATSPPLSLIIDGSGFVGRGAALSAVIGSSASTTDVLRTHCPGPSSGDVTGAAQLFGAGPSGEPLAQGLIAVRKLGARQIGFALRDPGVFSGAGYSGTRGGALGFSLTLLGAAGGTRLEQGG